MASFTPGQRVAKLTRGGHTFEEGEYLGSVYTKQGEELCVAVRTNGIVLNPAPLERWRALDDPPVRWTVAPLRG